ncbi:MEX3C ligase, partial [Tachuris rubrigastra]|nr:MEX3C ligase [Tachuris rubrigastra]
RTGCKIKALRAKTNTYIKTPIRGQEPVFVVTGRREDVAAAKRDILSAAEHFSVLRAWRGRGGPAPPGQTTVRVRVPYRAVGLVVGPKGATIKRIQQQTHTLIVTPGRDGEPVFEVTGTAEGVERAREEMERHIALRTGGLVELAEGGDFHCSGTDVGFEGGTAAWASRSPLPPARSRTVCSCRNDSSGSLGSGSTDSCFGGSRLADFSPTSPLGTGSFCFGETEDPAVDSAVCDSLPTPTPTQTVWAPFEPVNAPCGFGGDTAGPAQPRRRGSQPSATPRLSPTFPERPLPIHIPAFSSGTNSYSSSNAGSASSSPPESRRRHECLLCFDGEAGAALVPCGHSLFCPGCAGRICDREAPACPMCRAAVTQDIQTHS